MLRLLEIEEIVWIQLNLAVVILGHFGICLNQTCPTHAYIYGDFLMQEPVDISLVVWALCEFCNYFVILRKLLCQVPVAGCVNRFTGVLEGMYHTKVVHEHSQKWCMSIVWWFSANYSHSDTVPGHECWHCFLFSSFPFVEARRTRQTGMHTRMWWMRPDSRGGVDPALYQHLTSL